MAIGWLMLLKAVPWSEVISNAPKVVEGAKELWNASTKKSPGATPASSLHEDGIATMRARIEALEHAASDLHTQMISSSELIKALAEQNAQLIKRMERLRKIITWLTGVGLAALVSAYVLLMMKP